jgi:hypothetical protein
MEKLAQQNQWVEVAKPPFSNATQTATKQVIFSTTLPYQNQVNAVFRLDAHHAVGAFSLAQPGYARCCNDS